MPDTPDELDTLIDSVAAGPSSAAQDGRSATAQDLDKLQRIRDRRAADDAASNGGGKFGLRFTTLVPPGCG